MSAPGRFSVRGWRMCSSPIRLPRRRGPGWFCLMLLALLGASPLTAQVDPAHRLFDEVVKEHVAGGLVDYPGVAKDERFARYLRQLSATDPWRIPDSSDRLAFWINAYNAFTIRIVLDHWPLLTLKDVQVEGRDAWEHRWIRIKDRTLSLNEIEHGIVRKEWKDPRVHFALVCASLGCPPLRSEAYVGTRVREQMADNSRIFFADINKNRFVRARNVLYMSELMKWYADDFVPAYGSAEAYALKEIGFPAARPDSVGTLLFNWRINAR